MADDQVIEPANLFGPSNAVTVVPTPTLLDPKPDPTFELLLTLLHPSKRVRTSNQKTKNTKPESENKGPYDISITTDWDTFLDIITEKLSVEHTDLAVSSFEWHWLKPVSSPWLPLQDEGGFALMVKKVKSKPDPYIIVRMQAPVRKRARFTAGSIWDDVDELESDAEDNRIPKKGRLDEDIDDIVSTLSDKYPPGRCQLHPKIRCFHHQASKLHFKLDRPRLLVWANAIKSERTSYDKVPLSSPMFHPSLAFKHASNDSDTTTTTAAAAQPPIPTPNMPLTQMPQMPIMPFPQYPPMIFPQIYPQASSFMGYGPHGIPFSQIFPVGQGMASMPTRSPPSSPPTANCTIADFCETYSLGEQAVVGLEKLGFCFRDDLTMVTPEEYTGVGFKVLEWRRVLSAYKKLKKDSRHR